jgi:beta-phosphoglucomutase-like phosphatase (HAD superfamily)
MSSGGPALSWLSRLPAEIEKLKIEGYFGALADPAAVSMGKPDPEIFFQAADLLKVPYRNCIGIEDAQAGIEAINAAGMFSVGVGSNLADADWTVSDTSVLTLAHLGDRFAQRRPRR